MFSNCGKKVQSVSKFLGYSGIVVGVLIFIVGAINYSDASTYYYTGAAQRMTGTICMIWGVLCGVLSYISAVFLSAFGELVQDTKSIKEQLELKSVE